MLTLATFAVALKIMIPAGFMSAAPSNDLPFPLVICTGQGPMVLAPGDALPDPGRELPSPEKDAHSAPCVFAGHAAGAPPPSAAGGVVTAFVAYIVVAHRAAPDLAPGQGLAGPPPPARGPPLLLI